MDTIAHGLTGAVIGYCGFRQRAGRAALWASVAAAEFPDTDIVLLLLGQDTYLEYHRSVTHSALLLPFWATVVAWAVWELTGRKNFRVLWLAAVAGMVSHVVLDWVTSYGTMLLWPVGRWRFSLNWVFILDPYVWALLGVALWAAIRTQRASMARIGIAVIGGYLLFCGAAQWLVGRAEGGTAFAQPMNPLRWVVVRTEGDTVRWTCDGQDQVFRQYQDETLVRQAEATEAVKLFRWFAEFPVVERREEAGYTVLRYRDLRFRSVMPWGDVREGLFIVVKAVFDERGRLITAQLASDE